MAIYINHDLNKYQLLDNGYNDLNCVILMLLMAT